MYVESVPWIIRSASEVDRLFDEVSRGFSRRRGGGSQQLDPWTPAIDVLTKGGNLFIQAELPGVKLDDVHITLQNGVLSISGEQKADQVQGLGWCHVRERRYGPFRRNLVLPEGIDESKIHACLKNGVLEVTVEGAAIEQTPKRIEIEGSGS